MENVRIKIEDYPLYLTDIYYSLLGYVEKYVNKNYNPLEFLDGESDYARTLITGKQAIKELLDYFKYVDTICLPKSNIRVKVSTLTFETQQMLLDECKRYIMCKFKELEKQEEKSEAQK